MRTRLSHILFELKGHAPFTLFGALTGLVCMFLFRSLGHRVSHNLFYVFHPLHVVLSAMVTASMFQLHSNKSKFIVVLAVGFIGSLGIATLSDSVIPYIGEWLLGFHPHSHIGFIEAWYIVNPAAVLGVLLAFFWPRTKFPHAGHVLFSTWASSFHMVMAMSGHFTLVTALGSLVFLFLAVWLPCCVSDIVLPLLFVRDNAEAPVLNHQ